MRQGKSKQTGQDRKDKMRDEMRKDKRKKDETVFRKNNNGTKSNTYEYFEHKYSKEVS